MPTSIYLKASNNVKDESEKTIPRKNRGNTSFWESFNEPFLIIFIHAPYIITARQYL